MNDVEAAVRVAGTFGFSVTEPVLLRSTNNLVTWLRPLMIVAKIRVGQQRGFRTEVSVASALGALGGPVVPPAPEFPAIVHSHGGFDVTFWRYYPQPSDVDIPGEQVAETLQSLHATYSKISPELRATLPSYLEELQSVSELLRDDTRLSALPEVDRHLLIRAFETTCIGPVESDLAHTSPGTVQHYAAAIDTELLETCRDLVRVKTTAWCWADIDRGDLRDHAELHLAHLKKTFAAATYPRTSEGSGSGPAPS